MLYQQIAQNKRKTIYVLIGFYVLVGLMGAALGYFCYGSGSWVLLLRTGNDWNCNCDRRWPFLHDHDVDPINVDRHEHE